MGGRVGEKEIVEKVLSLCCVFGETCGWHSHIGFFGESLVKNIINNR